MLHADSCSSRMPTLTGLRRRRGGIFTRVDRGRGVCERGRGVPRYLGGGIRASIDFIRVLVGLLWGNLLMRRVR